jgi:glycosyltransferase 2 family protein
MDDSGAVALARRTWHFLAGFCIAAACLAWVFRDTDPAKLASSVSKVRTGWIVAAVVCDITSYVCEGSRWRILLSPVGPISVVRTTQAVYAGLFVNEILPLRPGEVLRAFLVSRWMSAPVSEIVPSLLLARAIDAMWLAVAIGCTAVVAPLPGDLLVAADVLGLVVFACVGILFFFSTRETKVISRLPSHIRRIFHRLADTRPRMACRAAVYSAGIPTLQALAFWFVMRACGLRESLAIGLAVFLIVHVGTAVPNAPANLGSYQVLTVVGLTLFGVDKSEAAVFSIVVFVVLTLPLWIIGLAALWCSGVSFADLRHRPAVV